MQPLRIGIVNDALISREVLRRLVASVGHYQVAWLAENGIEAVDRCAQDTPDLILMDLLMPLMDGVEATRRIMQQSPCAILLVTASVNQFASKVFEAMGHGALDAVNTPELGLNISPTVGPGLLGKIATIAKLIGRAPKVLGPTIAIPSKTAVNPHLPHLPHLLAVGASTGGPQALATILRAIPRESKLAVVIVQHIDAQFAPGLVEWLQQQASLPVTLARSGTIAQCGTITIAGGDRHLVMGRNSTLMHRLNHTKNTYCPSVDILFQSLATHWTGTGTGVLLTGMGRDGALGLKQLRDGGWQTIAQDEASCVVFGMPRAAAELGAANLVLPISEIAQFCGKLAI
jgi:two-component system, chemotaxis family, response regulator WspF